MKVLLTGGTGYIGSHTAVVLCKSNHEIFLLDNLVNSSAGVIDRIKQITGRRLSFIQGDVRDTRLVQSTLLNHNIELIIHFAGLKAVGESTEKPIDYYSNNVSATVSLLQAMQSTAVKKLVFSSSATVYGQPQYLPLDEDHPTSATNPYGRTKLHIEEMLSDLASSDPEWAIASLRYFNPVGAHESGLIGETPSGTPNNLMPYIAQVATGLRSELSVFGDDYPTCDGTGVRDYIHVMDLAEGHAAALDFLKKSKGCHHINLGTGTGYSVLQMIRSFEQASGRKIPYRIAPRRPGDVSECFADPQKAALLLGWSATRTLSDMCASAWRFQQSCSSQVTP